jgi:hypothetical protein
MVCTEKTFTFYQMCDGDKPGAKHQIVATINEAAIFYIRNKFGDKKLQNFISKVWQHASRLMGTGRIYLKN